MLDRDETVEGVLGFFKNDFMPKQRKFVRIIMYKRDKRLEFIINSKLKKVILNYGRK